ncbi:protease modulator HflC [Oleiphilus sp. HI0009]|nr:MULTISPECIES: protease modulator HflC [unclassified Oleiphilus]KZX75575.1 protease modulator HflC [Oleiphilus sp. HI0009]MCH2159149.1 protease modulator HflC [Oleiphilaceae bacterium]KZY68836.1 protease modulator HflC [Oleiphilus sp. HI0067]KZY69421.1 protease modulator HflC [Oleiphilus sp. HI0066]KZZ58087.1 protease modulator HflC [Oleiphilus sp. HI0125]
MSKSVLSLVAVLIAIVVLSSSLYIVDERQVAIKLQFGEIVESDIGPGIHFKMPFVQNIRKFDARILTLDSRPERFLTVGKKFLIVDSFVKWQIEDVSAYYKATAGNRWQATTLLSNSTNKGLRDEFASRSLTEVVSGERDELMSDITTKLNEQTLAEFGIRVLDVRVKGIDLPEDLSKDVYRRMSTEREREARETRSQGRELAEGIRADADREKVVIESDAYRESEITRGEGDAIAASTYAEAFNKNPEFYAFTRSLQAYKDTFANKEDVLLLKPDSEFFKYLNQAK